MEQTLTVLSWNVNGFTQKKKEVLHYLNHLQADVVFLQETHIGPSTNYPEGSIQFEDMENNYNWTMCTIFKRNCRGVAILFRKNLECEGLKVIGDEKGRYMLVSCHIEEKEFVFVNLYNPKDEKIDFSQFGDFLKQASESSYFVVGGDFNTVMDAQVDKTSSNRNRGHKDRFKGVENFLEKFNLVDVWRWLYPEEKSFTYFDRKGQSRLDYFFLPIELLSKVITCKIHKRPQYVDKESCISDHAPISIQIQITGHRCFFNSAILKNGDILEKLSQMITNISEMKRIGKGDLWPALKVRIYCEILASKNTELNLHSLRNLPDIQNSYMTPNKTEQTGSVWSSSHIHVPQTKPSNLDEYLVYLNETKMFEDLELTLNVTLTEPVSKHEILSAILSLYDSEHLTPDGLPVLFYKHFASKLTDLLQAFFNQLLDLQRITCLFNESFASGAFEATSLTFENTDHTYSDNTQHHSLVTYNIDYNILTTILAERLKRVMGYMLNQGKIRLWSSIQNCINTCEKNGGAPVIAVSVKVDPNTVQWLYLCQCLTTLHLPDKFTSVLKTLLFPGGTKNNFCSRVSQGLKVGCPLTPILISLCLFPLINSIDCDDRLQGILIGRGHIKSVLNQDAVIIFLSNTNEDLQVLEEVLNDFKENSGFGICSRISEISE